jgi:hypothetical protein
MPPGRTQTDWAKQALIQATMGSLHSTVLPATWYVALLVNPVVPTDTAGSVIQPTQAQYKGYAPVAYTNASAQWSLSGGVATNTCPIAFTNPSINGTTVLASYWALMTAPSVGGQVFAWGALPVPQIVGAASVQPRFLPGTLRVSAVDPPDLST